MDHLQSLRLVLLLQANSLGNVAVEKLAGFTGPVLTDGFKSYDEHLNEANIPHAYCWAHARREFLPLEGHDPNVKPILDLIDELFAIERKAKDIKDLAQLRTDESSVILESLMAALIKEHPVS